ncbi:MAG TPA: hypothetical protein VF905_09695, partial [Nitrospirota bacterium]
FFDKVPQRNYQEALTPEQISKYETLAKEQLGEECARWLEKGRKMRKKEMTSRKLPHNTREAVLC